MLNPIRSVRKMPLEPWGQWGVGRGGEGHSPALAWPWPHERSKINPIMSGICGDMAAPSFIFIPSQGHVSGFMWLASIWRIETEAEHILVTYLWIQARTTGPQGFPWPFRSMTFGILQGILSSWPRKYTVNVLLPNGRQRTVLTVQL